MKKFNKTFDEVFNYTNLYESYKKCLNGVRWKGSVQNFELKSIEQLNSLLKALQNETLVTGRFFEFTIMERGKIRHIKSVGIAERVVQRCLCDYCLVPALYFRFIYDNSACIKGKGVHFAYNRMKEHLRKCTQDDYILQFDFSKYFDTIPHDKLIYKLSKIITDKKIMRLLNTLINNFGGDRGLGLGSQISQICALYYPSYIDHYFATQQNVIAYGRYMDDGYIISHDKKYLQQCKEKLIELAQCLDLCINEKKTVITKLNNKFIYLKARFYLTKTGKIVVKPNKKNMSRNRRKLKILKKTLPDNKFLEVKQCILGTLQYFDSYYFREEIKQI